MSMPNINNNMIQQQNIVLNQVPIQHGIMGNANNGIPLATALSHTPSSMDHSNEMKTGMVVDSSSMAGSSLANVHGPMKILQSSSSSDQAQLMTKHRLQDLVRETDATLNLEEDVEEIILNYVDEFVDKCLNGAALIAKNRNTNTIEVKDVQQVLNRNYNMWTPGFGTDDLRRCKKSLTTEAHKQRLALIRKTLKKY